MNPRKSLFILTLFVNICYGQYNIHLVQDINQNQVSPYIGRLFSHNNSVFFMAKTPQYGEEPWVSDGTSSGTVLLKDIDPGIEDSSPKLFTTANGFLYFVADGRIWKSDGTSSGTQMIPTALYYSENLQVIGNFIYFVGYNYLTGAELWKLDLTTNVASMVKDITPGFNYPPLYGLTNIDGTLYFAADDGVNGYELWKSDGTEAGTQLIKDIYVGSGSAFNSSQYYPGFVKAGSSIYFFARDATNGFELWKTDGTTANTLLVKNLSSGGSDSQGGVRISYNGELYFYKKNTSNNWVELWKSDGTETGTTLFDIGPIEGFYPIILNSELIYAKSTEIWKTNGTTKSLLNNNLQTFSSIILFNNRIYFSGIPYTNTEAKIGVELWVSDGTTSGTYLLKNIATGKQLYDLRSSSPSEFIVNNNIIFFTANDGLHGKELWKTDGTSAGTVLVKDIYQNGSEDSNPSSFLPIGNKFIFKASPHHPLDPDIFISHDSTGNSISKIFESESGISMGFSNDTTAFFTYQYDCYKVNHTFTGVDLLPIKLWEDNIIPVELNNNLYFPAYINSIADIYVFKMNSTGTFASVATNHKGASKLLKVDNVIFFTATDYNNFYGSELWRTDGTSGGTYMVKNIMAGNGSSIDYNSPKVALNGILYFIADNGINGSELWRSDGTASGTYMVQDIHLGSTPSSIFAFTVFNNKLYFLVDEGGTLGKHLWVSDGTSAGTQLVSNFNNRWTQFDYFPKIHIANSLMFFSVYAGGTRIYDLWKSDGTTAGTIEVRDNQNNIVGTNANVISTGDFIIFGGYYPTTGFRLHQLCISDGSPMGTKILNSTVPVNFFKFKNKVFFSGDDAFNKRELWSLDLLDCQLNRVMNSPSFDFNNNNHKYEVNNSINATNKITNSANVIYDAKNSIILNAGFSVSQGAIFKAQIDGCGNN